MTPSGAREATKEGGIMSVQARSVEEAPVVLLTNKGGGGGLIQKIPGSGTTATDKCIKLNQIGTDSSVSLAYVHGV